MRFDLPVASLSLAALLSLGGCGGFTELEDVSCPPEGTDVTYENFAESFFALHCNQCHGAGVEDRNGAPIAYVFDTYDQVYALRERVFLRSAGENITMPPGPDDPPRQDRELLAEWIACDAPPE